MFVYIRGGQPEVLAAIEQCAQENGGSAVGAPTVKRDWMGVGGKITIIHILEEEDPKEWWSDWGLEHSILMIPDDEVETFLEKTRASSDSLKSVP